MTGQEPAFPADAFAVHKDLPRDQILKLEACRGLTKREWFAGMALSGMLASCPEGIRFNPKERPLPIEAWAEYCFKMADAMLKEAGK